MFTRVWTCRLRCWIITVAKNVSSRAKQRTKKKKIHEPSVHHPFPNFPFFTFFCGKFIHRANNFNKFIQLNHSVEFWIIIIIVSVDGFVSLQKLHETTKKKKITRISIDRSVEFESSFHMANDDIQVYPTQFSSFHCFFPIEFVAKQWDEVVF